MANLIRRRENEPSTTMGRFDPFRTFRDLLRGDPLGRDMFRLLDPLADIDPAALQSETMFMPNVEVKETRDAFIFKADLPGIEEEDVEVSISGNRLTICGKREEEDRREGDRYFSYERSYGAFSRSFTLPDGVDMDKVKADLNQGVLTLVVPKKEASQARRITLSGKGEEKGGQTMAAQASGGQTPAAGEEQAATTATDKEQAGQRKAA